MTRNLKVLGLALVAMFAMSAVVASSASAWFTSDSDETTLTAIPTGPQTFTATGTLFITCENLALEGTTVGTEQETITAVPAYSECTLGAEGVEAPAFVNMNGCDYTFTTDQIIHIDCPEEKQIEVKGEFVPPFKSKCIDIPPQTPTEPNVDYTNQGSGTTRHVEVDSTVKGITYTLTGICGSETFHDAEYHGEVTITGEDHEENHIGVEWHEE